MRRVARFTKKQVTLIRELSLLTCAFGAAWLVTSRVGHAPTVTDSIDVASVASIGSVNIDNPATKPAWSRAVLESALKTGGAILFGSSELTFRGETAVDHMFQRACGRPAVLIGRAGFQSLPILLTLAEARDAIGPKSDITIIVSPGWFAEHGTPTAAFLRYLKPNMLRQLNAQADLPHSVRAALARHIQRHRDDLSGLYLDWLPSWIGTAPALTAASTTAASLLATPAAAIRRPPTFDWEGSLRQWREFVVSESGGNPFGVEKAYMDKYRDRAHPIAAPPLDPWGLEREDMFALSDFLAERGAHARFIVQPIHRRIFNHLEGYDNVIEDLRQHVTAAGHRWTNFFTEPYDMHMLQDSTHFSAYGWVHVQRAMCE